MDVMEDREGWRLNLELLPPQPSCRAMKKEDSLYLTNDSSRIPWSNIFPAVYFVSSVFMQLLQATIYNERRKKSFIVVMGQ